MVEVDTELLYLEFTRLFKSSTFWYLQKVADMVVQVLYLLLGREGTLQLSLQVCCLLTIAKEYGMRRLAVATCSSCFLIILFQGVWRIQMYHQSDIGIVYAHTEGVGGYHDAYSSLLPVTLAEVFLEVRQSGMEECYGVSLHAKHGGYVFSLLSAVGIYYGTT